MGSVSVVIPCKDDAHHLAMCLAALAKQTRQADEVIVVDNESSDDSAAVALASGLRSSPARSQGFRPPAPQDMTRRGESSSSDSMLTVCLPLIGSIPSSRCSQNSPGRPR